MFVYLGSVMAPTLDSIILSMPGSLYHGCTLGKKEEENFGQGLRCGARKGGMEKVLKKGCVHVQFNFLRPLPTNLYMR